MSLWFTSTNNPGSKLPYLAFGVWRFIVLSLLIEWTSATRRSFYASTFLILSSSSSVFFRWSGMYIAFKCRKARADALMSTFHLLFRICLASHLPQRLCLRRYLQPVDGISHLMGLLWWAYWFWICSRGLKSKFCPWRCKYHGHSIKIFLLHVAFFVSNKVSREDDLEEGLIHHKVVQVEGAIELWPIHDLIIKGSTWYYS